MIVSTLSSYPGQKIVKQLGIISAYDDKLRTLRMTVDSHTYIENALQQLAREAENLGANGVLGINFSMSEKTLPVVIGTAVILEAE